MRLRVVPEPSEEGGFTVYVPSLPGCISEGDTVEEALANIREAIELYLEPVEDGNYSAIGGGAVPERRPFDFAATAGAAQGPFDFAACGRDKPGRAARQAANAISAAAVGGRGS